MSKSIMELKKESIERGITLREVIEEQEYGKYEAVRKIMKLWNKGENDAAKKIATEHKNSTN